MKTGNEHSQYEADTPNEPKERNMTQHNPQTKIENIKIEFPENYNPEYHIIKCPICGKITLKSWLNHSIYSGIEAGYYCHNPKCKMNKAGEFLKL